MLEFTKRKVLHYPKLDTVLMVEDFIKKHSAEYKKKALWKALPKKMMYQTFCVIIDYLIYTNKIAIDRNKVVGYVYFPEEAKYYLSRTDLSHTL